MTVSALKLSLIYSSENGLYLKIFLEPGLALKNFQISNDENQF